MGKVNKVCFFQSSSSWRFLVLALGINGRNANGINTPPEPLGGITAQMYWQNVLEWFVQIYREFLGCVALATALNG